MTDQLRTSHAKKGFITALTKGLGIVSKASRATGTSRRTHYNWLKTDTEYALEVESIKDEALDFAESKLHERISGIRKYDVDKSTGEKTPTDEYQTPPSDTAIIFYLKTQAKSRGYVERSEVEIKTKKPLSWMDEVLEREGVTKSSLLED